MFIKIFNYLKIKVFNKILQLKDNIIVNIDRLKLIGIPCNLIENYNSSLINKEIDKILLNHNNDFNKLFKQNTSIMDTPTEYYKKSSQERYKMMINNFKMLFFNISILSIIYLFNKNIQEENMFIILSKIFYSIITTDMLTGMIHLTLDNPITKLHHNNFIRNAAWQFQEHHDNPTDTTNPPLIHVLLYIGNLQFTVLITFLMYNIIFNKSFTILSVTSFLLSILGQWNHRVVHTNLTPKHYFHNTKMWLMKRGMLLSPKKHYLHHQTYDLNFCTLTGWTDWIVNRFNKSVVNKNNRYCFLYLIIYMYILVLYVILF